MPLLAPTVRPTGLLPVRWGAARSGLAPGSRVGHRAAPLPPGRHVRTAPVAADDLVGHPAVRDPLSNPSSTPSSTLPSFADLGLPADLCLHAAPCAGPRADARAGPAGPGVPGPARRGRRPHQPHRLRRRRPEPPGPGAAQGGGRPHRLPRPPRGPHRPGALPPRCHRDQRARRGRPHGRPRLPPGRPPAAQRDAQGRAAPALLRDPRQGRRRAGQAVPRPARDPRGRLAAVAGEEDGPPRPAARPRAPAAHPGRPDQRAGPHGRLHPHQARREGADPAAQQGRRADRRAARQPRSGRPHPQHGGLPLRPGHHPGRDRHRRPRHPRRRRGPGRARRPARRAQGLPAPLGAYGAGRLGRHRGHAEHPRAGP